MTQMVKNLPAMQQTSVDPWAGKSPGEGNGYSLQYCCLENSMDRGAWWGTAHGVSESQTRLSDFPKECCGWFDLLYRPLKVSP